jgi:ethanolamine ammonia-lyase small subunit
MNAQPPTPQAEPSVLVKTPDAAATLAHQGSAAAAPAPSADSWHSLRRYTSARIAVGRTGGSQRTASLLDFRLSHARARDAVHSLFDGSALGQQLSAHAIESFYLDTAATDRRTYLLRPDLGRKLDSSARHKLLARAPSWGHRDLAIIVSDGLAAQAADHHATATLVPLIGQLRASGWSLFPVFIVPFARVKLQDEIGELLGARHTLILLGERPGLGSPDSLGAYFTFNPNSECTDADRNCISNIRPEGLPPVSAADKLVRLLSESARLGLSGVALKDTDSPPAPVLV